MCLIPGLADGRYVNADGLVEEHLLTTASCTCHVQGPTAPGVTRRGLLGRAAGMAGAGLMLGAGLRAPASARAQAGAAAPGGDALVFLGTNGGPVLSATRAQPSCALRVNGTTYLVDAGGDVLFQLQKAGIPVSSVAHLFITHGHSDHVAGYPALAILGWAQNPPLKRLDVWGPKVKDMHAGLLQVFAGDIASREFMQGQTPFRRVVHGHSVDLERGDHRIAEVFSDNNVKVSAMRVFHGSYAEMPYAYAYRFDLKASGQSVVFSGDTTPTDGMAKLAADCDLLVHEAMYLPGVDQVVQLADPSVRTALRTHLLSTHTIVEDVPKVAKNAKAKRVVMTHLVPSFIPPAVFASTARAAAGAVGYGGEVSVAKDLDAVTL